MIRFTWYELLWLFFIYSFLGWVLETAAATVKQKKFANRGLVNGPFCVIYGIAALFMTFGLQELRGVWLFLFATIYATVIEWVAGHLIEKAFKARCGITPRSDGIWTGISVSRLLLSGVLLDISESAGEIDLRL